MGHQSVIANTMYSVRSHVASRVWSGVLVLGCIAVALLLLVEGMVFGGLIMLMASIPASWLSGLWVVPWSTDAYLRKLMLIMQNIHSDLLYGGYQRREQLRIMGVEVADLTPPQQYVGTYGSVLTIIGQLEGIIDDKEGNFADRAVGVFEQYGLLLHIRVELESKSDAYPQAAYRVLERYRLFITSSMDKNEDLLQRHTRQIKNLRPSGRWITWHKGFVLALLGYTEAICSYYRAVREDNLEEVKLVAKNVSVARSILEAERLKYVEEFGDVSNARRRYGRPNTRRRQ
jgi:hypothetical protein